MSSLKRLDFCIVLLALHYRAESDHVLGLDSVISLQVMLSIDVDVVLGRLYAHRIGMKVDVERIRTQLVLRGEA